MCTYVFKEVGCRQYNQMLMQLLQKKIINNLRGTRLQSIMEHLHRYSASIVKLFLQSVLLDQ